MSHLILGETGSGKVENRISGVSVDRALMVGQNFFRTFESISFQRPTHEDPAMTAGSDAHGPENCMVAWRSQFPLTESMKELYGVEYSVTKMATPSSDS